MSGHGGRRAGAGRKKGVPNKTTAELREVAAEYGPAAIAKLAAMAGLDGAPGAESEPAQLGALRELLDRGFGRAPQAITGQDGAPVRFVIYAPEPVSSVQDWLRLHAPHDVVEDDVDAEECGSSSASHMPARI